MIQHVGSGGLLLLMECFLKDQRLLQKDVITNLVKMQYVAVMTIAVAQLVIFRAEDMNSHLVIILKITSSKMVVQQSCCAANLNLRILILLLVEHCLIMIA